MRQIRLASRYAKALFELTGEKQVRNEVFADMQTLANICQSNRDFRLMLQSPVIKHDKKSSVFRALFENRFNHLTLQYVNIIIRKRRENILEEIALQYVELYREWKGIKLARLETPVPIDEQQRNRFITMLKDQFKAEIELETVIKPQLVGGFILSVEGKQFDASVQNKIKKLTREFQVNIYKKQL